MIEINEVSKAFGEVVALSNNSMKVKKGSVTGFLGPNGAGKSTTIKLIMGEIKPDNGDVRVLGETPFNNISLRRRTGYCSEHDDLYIWMKGEQFVLNIARFHIPREQAIRATKEALKKVGMDHKASKRIRSYSKGMKQRLKVAAALVHDPELLILDEPFGGLDPLGRREMKQLVAELNTQGVTVLISSHILYELDEMSNRMILIHRGQTLAEGAPSDILNLIDQFPHQIRVQAPYESLQRLSKLLIEEDIVKTITFSTTSDTKEKTLVLTTEDPTSFYPTTTRLVAENNLLITLLETQTDNIEGIFDYLT